MSDRRADALTALQVLAVEDAYDAAVTAQGASGAAVTDPALDPRLQADWAVAGTILGTDSLFRKGVALTLADRTVFYGWVLRHKVAPGTFLCLIRGTKDLIEWAEDAEAAPVAMPGWPGKVEQGFAGIYGSMALRQPGGAVLPLLSGITGVVGLGTLMVAGHSLGAALATMLAADLADPARLGDRVSLRAFASPRPGDIVYAQYASGRIADAVLYANALDIVTHIPAGLGYAELEETVTLWPDNKIKLNPFALHHVLSYSFLIDPSALDLTSLPPIDKPYIDCVRLPAAKAA